MKDEYLTLRRLERVERCSECIRSKFRLGVGHTKPSFLLCRGDEGQWVTSKRLDGLSPRGVLTGVICGEIAGGPHQPRTLDRIGEPSKFIETF
jgi:hypothetical protein